MVYSKTVRISTRRNKEILDLTGEVAAVVAASGVQDGLALVFTKHTTTGLISSRPGALIFMIAWMTMLPVTYSRSS
jgi:thiamine phosphate synthase YjbQ (UPF0047 family)